MFVCTIFNFLYSFKRYAVYDANAVVGLLGGFYLFSLNWTRKFNLVFSLLHWLRYFVKVASLYAVYWNTKFVNFFLNRAYIDGIKFLNSTSSDIMLITTIV